MRLGFQRLINAGSLVSTVDLEASRPDRQRLHEQVWLRNHLLTLLAVAPVDEDLVRVSPLRLVDGRDDEPNQKTG